MRLEIWRECRQVLLLPAEYEKFCNCLIWNKCLLIRSSEKISFLLVSSLT